VGLNRSLKAKKTRRFFGAVRKKAPLIKKAHPADIGVPLMEPSDSSCVVGP
jgi:hypothetical protein